MTEDVTALVTESLRRFLAEKTPDPLKLRDAAAALEALPTVKDMGGCFLIRVDGVVISFAWDKAADWRVELDPRIRNLVLFAAAQKYPELMPLMPRRPPGAPVCPFCNGTGKHPITTKPGLENVGCYCGGLGWIPPGDPEARDRESRS